MLDNHNNKTVSRRETNTWIPGCPVQIKEVSLVLLDEKLYTTAKASPCTDEPISYYVADIIYYNQRREEIGQSDNVRLDLKGSVEAEFSDAAYAEAVVRSVYFADGTFWEAAPESVANTLPEQEVIWQTDPLYNVIKKATQGVVSAKYFPDKLEDGWRCACGQINIHKSNNCGACGCSREWLTKVFDRNYLESQKTAVEEGRKPEQVKIVKKKEAEKLVSDKAKFAIIVSALLLVVIITLLTIFYLIPQSKYNTASELATRSEFDKAIDILHDLGNFKNSKELAERFTYEKYAELTGIYDLYITTTDKEPWFEIDETGSLEFISTKYTGSWDDFKIPHVVNGIVATKLAKNFCINCSELTEIIIPDTVVIIGDQAFLNCASLTKIVFGKNVHTIEQRAFIDCESLEEIVIPDTVINLGQRAFNNCKKLKSITLGSGIKEIGPYTFSNCTSLEEIIINTSLSSIGDYAFSGCNSLARIVCSADSSEWTAPDIGEGNEVWNNIQIIFENN